MGWVQRYGLLTEAVVAGAGKDVKGRSGKKGRRKEWREGGCPASAGLCSLLIPSLPPSFAGHLVPMDQPLAALDMITRFIEGQAPFAPPAAAEVVEEGREEAREGGEGGSGAVLLALEEELEETLRQEM